MITSEEIEMIRDGIDVMIRDLKAKGVVLRHPEDIVVKTSFNKHEITFSIPLAWKTKSESGA